MPERDVTLNMGVNSKEALKAMDDFEKAVKRLSQVLSHTSQPSKELRNTFSNLRKASSDYNSTLRKLQGDTTKYNKNLSRQVDLENKLKLQRQSLAEKQTKIDKKEEEIRAVNQLIKDYSKLSRAIGIYQGLRNKGGMIGTGFRNLISEYSKKVGFEDSFSEDTQQKVNSLLEKQLQKNAKLQGQVNSLKLGYDRQAESVRKTTNELISQYPEAERLYDSLDDNISKLVNSTAEFSQLVSKSGILNFFNNLKNAVKGVWSDFKKLLSVLRRAVSLFSKLSGISSLLKGLKSSLGGSNMELKDGIKYLIQYGFGFRSLYFLVRKLKSEFVGALEDMGKSIPQVQTSLDSLSKSMNTLRGGLAVAFAPLLKYVAALMERLAAIAINAANAIAQFFAVITGQNVWFKMASSVSGYTDAVKGSTKATKDNEKELKKQLAAFDDIDVLVKDLDDDLENTTPGGSGGASGSELGAWQPLGDPKNKLAELIKEAWASDDTLKAFETVGVYIGEYLQKALDNLLTDFWPPLRAKTEKIALAIAGTINGFFQTDAVVSFAKNIAAALNLALSTLSNYWNGVNWGNMGKKLNESIHALIDDIEWDTLVSYLSGKIQGLFELAYNTLGDGSWITKIATKLSGVIKGTLEKVDFRMLGSTINTFLVNLFDGISKILQDNSKGVSTAISEFLDGLQAMQIAISFGKMLFELFKFALNQAFTLLKESQVFSTLLMAFFGFELLKEGIKTLLMTLFANLITGALSAALAGEAAATTVAGGFASLLGNAFISGVISFTTGALLAGGMILIGTAIGNGIDSALRENTGYISGRISTTMYEAVQGANGEIYAQGKNGGLTLVQGTQVGIGENGYLVTDEVTGLSYLVTNKIEDSGKEINGIIARHAHDGRALIKDNNTGIVTDTQDATATLYEAWSTKIQESNLTVDQKSKAIKALIQALNKNSVEDTEAALQQLAQDYNLTWDEVTTKVDESATTYEEDMGRMSDATTESASTVANNPIIPKVITDFIDSAIAKVQTLLSLIGQANGASISVPSIGNTTSKINSTTRKIGSSTMVKAAKGAVIPPNKPFLAMLGDQTRGTNVETPLSTITEALHEALNSYGFNIGGAQEVVLNIDGTTLARLTVPHNLKELNRQGYNVKVLERK